MLRKTIQTKAIDTHVPSYAHEGDCGADLRCDMTDLSLAPGETKLVPTGVCIAFEPTMVGMICSRSGLAAKHQIHVLNAPGIIEPTYRGELKVVLHNARRLKLHEQLLFAWQTFLMKLGFRRYPLGRIGEVVLPHGSRIAQLVFVSCIPPTYVQTEHFDESNRGENGFGSTGIM